MKRARVLRILLWCLLVLWLGSTVALYVAVEEEPQRPDWVPYVHIAGVAAVALGAATWSP